MQKGFAAEHGVCSGISHPIPATPVDKAYLLEQTERCMWMRGQSCSDMFLFGRKGRRDQRTAPLENRTTSQNVESPTSLPSIYSRRFPLTRQAKTTKKRNHKNRTSYATTRFIEALLHPHRNDWKESKKTGNRRKNTLKTSKHIFKYV